MNKDAITFKQSSSYPETTINPVLLRDSGYVEIIQTIDGENHIIFIATADISYFVACLNDISSMINSGEIKRPV